MQPNQRTQVKFALLGLLLEASGYEETSTRYLVDVFRQGFHLRLDRPINQLTLDWKRNKRTVEGNNKMALSNSQCVKAKLEKELLAKRMIGPFLGLVFQAYVISPLGLRKKKFPGKFRVIHDLSVLFEGISVNSCIPTKDGTVTYETMDTATRQIQWVGQGGILAKTDIEHTYKLIPVCLQERNKISALGRTSCKPTMVSQCLETTT